MNTTNKTSRILGFAFLFQFITSFTGGVFLRPLWFVDGEIAKSLIRIAENPWPLRVYILLEVLTALGVIFLGAVLYKTLRKQNENLALTAFGCYILEGAMLAASKIPTFSLFHLSQDYVTTGYSASLLTMGSLAVEATDFGTTLLMMAFCLGGILFYYLLDRSRIVPRVLSLWGLITVFPCLVGTLSSMLGYKLPFAIFVPYVPFELVIGIWILVKGIRE